MTTRNLTVKHFISEFISVSFNKLPQFSKKPPCPDVFTWQERTYHVSACLSERTDFSRSGRMVNNMQPQHAQVAGNRGSWGVGKFYFDVQTQENLFFRIYYDRAPKDAFDRKGKWILLAELKDSEV